MTGAVAFCTVGATGLAAVTGGLVTGAAVGVFADFLMPRWFAESASPSKWAAY